MHCLPQNCKEWAVSKLVRFVDLLSEGIRATNARGYMRSKHNSVFIQAKSIQVYSASQTKSRSKTIIYASTLSQKTF